MELESNDPAMVLLNEYISKEVDKRVKEAVEKAVMKLHTQMKSFTIQHVKDLQANATSKADKIDKDLAKMKVEINEVSTNLKTKQHHQVVSDVDYSDYDQSDQSPAVSDLEEMEDKRWGQTFGEPSGATKKMRMAKAAASDDEEASQKCSSTASSRGKPGKRGRPTGSRNKVLKADLEAQNKKLKAQLKKMQMKE